MKKVWISSVLGVVLVMTINTYASAANIIDGSGNLLGATDVNVNGSLYDVMFMDGTCIGLFGGCDGIDDFTFQTIENAVTASHALLDQVFVGLYDEKPELTNGIEFGTAWIATPYGIDMSLTELVWAWNNEDENLDMVISSQISRDLNTTANKIVVYSVWAEYNNGGEPVPEPATMLLFGTGLAGLAGTRIRKKKK